MTDRWMDRWKKSPIKVGAPPKNYFKSKRQCKRTVKTVNHSKQRCNLTDGSSQGTYIIVLVENNGCCNLLSWQSEQLKGIVRSSLTAEITATLGGLDIIFYIF